MLQGLKVLAVTVPGVSVRQTPDLARHSLEVLLLLCFMSPNPSVGFGLVTVFLTFF